MWTLDANTIIHLGRTPGGDRFTILVDAIIRAHCACLGIENAAIATNVRVNIADGGVDTEVRQGSADPAGYLASPTIWQFKAKDYADVTDASLRSDLQSPYARAQIERGYAYRFCICDDLPPQKRTAWLGILNAAIREINPHAPEALVLAASDLEGWVKQFPAIALAFTRTDLQEKVMLLPAWGANVIDTTRLFVPVPAWVNMQARLQQYVTISEQPVEAVFVLHGDAGVGKTRVTYEMLVADPRFASLVLYTNDEQHALDIARRLANEPSLVAILVADECSPTARYQLRECVRGHRQRIRVIAIDNSLTNMSSIDPEEVLPHIPEDVVGAILERNFPTVPAERRSLYASLSGGFVRLAADMCNHNALINLRGHLGPVVGTIEEYLEARFSREPEGLRVIEALACFTLVGYREDISGEFENFCRLFAMETEATRSIIGALQQRSGFVRAAGRFIYLSPEIVSRVALARAWRRWVAPDPSHFLAAIPEMLLPAFSQRVQKSAEEGVRQQVGDYFRHFFRSTTPDDLKDIGTVFPLMTLTETDPDAYLPFLRRLIDQATEEQLQATGESAGSRWSPRRQLVWLMERLVAFPEYFDAAEAILIRLAVAENESNIGNNATATWMQLYKIQLSGTAIPFPQRLQRLRERLFAEDQRVVALGARALNALLDLNAHRMVGPPIIAGRIPPPEWNPTTRTDEDEAYRHVVLLLAEMVERGTNSLHDQAYEITLTHIRMLLVREYLAEVLGLLDLDRMSEQQRVETALAVEECLQLDFKDATDLPRWQAYIAKIEEWLARLKPTDVHGRLVTVLTGNPWRYGRVADDGTAFQEELRALAAALFTAPPFLEAEISLLSSSTNYCVATIGYEIGVLDTTVSLLDRLVAMALECGSSVFLRGYIGALVQHRSEYLDEINRVIDQLELETPEVAHLVAMVAGESAHAFARTIRLVDDGRLSSAFLQGFLHAVAMDVFDLEKYPAALERLIRATEQGDEAAHRAALEFVAYPMEHGKPGTREAMIASQTVLELVWRLAALSDSVSGTDAYHWEQIFQPLISIDPDRAGRVAVTALFGKSYMLEQHAKGILSGMATKYPRSVMVPMGEAALDPERGWHFFIDNYTSILGALPVSIIEEWLAEVGVEGARHVARHLRTPEIGEDGQLIVPPLTAYVLEAYEDDDRVFHEFCAGRHALQVYMGDMATQMEQEADRAAPFRNHPLRRIREWVEWEIRSARHYAAQIRQEDEEQAIRSL